MKSRSRYAATFAVLSGLALSPYAAAPTASAASPNQGRSLRAGDLVAVRVDADIPAGQTANMFSFDLAYPENRFAPVSLDARGVCTQVIVSSAGDEDGRASVDCGITSRGLMGTGTVATLFLKSTRNQALPQDTFKLRTCRMFRDDGLATRLKGGCPALYALSASKVPGTSSQPIPATTVPSPQPRTFLKQPCNTWTGDLNCDGTVDNRDVSILFHSFGTGNAQADVTRDGAVNLRDFSVILSYYRNS